MKVLVISPGPSHVSPGLRYRIEQWQPYLENEGFEITQAPFMDEALRRVIYSRGRWLDKMAHLASAYQRQLGVAAVVAEFDLVYLFREAALIGPAVIESRIARTGTPIVFDFDDAVFERYRSPTNSYLSYLKFPSKTKTLCRRAAHVMAGNDYLADYARRHARSVSVVPTTIDTNVYRTERRRPASGAAITLGWTGSHSTAQHLQTIVPALETLARARKYRLVVIGADPPAIRGVDVEARPWRAETEVDDLADVDIGLMPLPDDRWSRGKCGLKALQYMALGIPAVVSRVGVNTTIVEDRVNGAHADEPDEWVERLEQLIDDGELRTRLGVAARVTVETHYSAERVAANVADILRRTVRE